MLIQTIEFDYTDDDELNGEIACPACGKPWVTQADGAADTSKPLQCPHLRFVLLPDAEAAEFFNGFSAAELAAAVEPAARSLCPDLDGESVMEFLISNRLEDELWQKMSSPAMDTLLKYSSSGIACGPVSHTAHFGALLGASPV
jgi:hypothetical protein